MRTPTLTFLVLTWPAVCASAASAQAPPPPEVSEVRVEVHSSEPALTLHQVSGQALAAGPGGVAVGFGFERICVAPCEARLPPGDYQFAVGVGTNIPLPVDDYVRLDGPTRLDVSYESRFGIRMLGLAVMAVSVGVGVGVMLLGLLQDGQPDELGFTTYEPSVPLLALGGGLALAGGIAGLIMMLQPDVREVTATPL